MNRYSSLRQVALESYRAVCGCGFFWGVPSVAIEASFKRIVVWSLLATSVDVTLKNRAYLPIIILLSCGLFGLMAGAASAQVRMFTTQPAIDSFPILRVGVSVTDSGHPAVGLMTSNFNLTEDGATVNGLQLSNCIAPPAAAIALLTDVTSSMYFSAGNGNFNAFYNSYSQFLSEVAAPSQIALIPFTDTISRYYPGIKRASGFYAAAVKADTTELMDSLRNLQFLGNTNIDQALIKAVGILQKSALQRKVIILVTDDAVVDRSGVYQYLAQNGITLFVMELDPDTLYSNYDLAVALGGRYFVAGDSTLYAPTMIEIGKSFLAEQCTLRYVSSNPCPWYAYHGVNVNLKYNGTVLTSRLSYLLGRDTHDTTAPILTIDSTLGTSLKVHAVEIFPCQTGIKFFNDSGLVNFAKLKQRRNLPDSSWDSIVVVDTLQPARGFYIVKDSAGNTRKIFVSYTPHPDVNPPQLPLTTILAGSFDQNITEQQPWDRGVMSVVLNPGARNLVLDSVHYFSRSFARAYLRVPNLKDSSYGCLTATDSVGHTNSACYQWNGEGGDTLAPLFSQDLIAEPRVSLSGRVTELRTGDIGLRTLQLTPVTNTKLPNVNYASPFSASVTVGLIDSLYPALCAVSAVDSAGNQMRDTLRYQPVTDVLPPQLVQTSPTGNTRLVSATEIRPWDRGLRTIVVAGTPINMTAGAITFADIHHGSVLFTVTDVTKAASATVVATDSLGNQASLDIAVPPLGPGALSPLQINSPLDFGSIPATTQLSKAATITNPNAVDVVMTKVATSGSDSVFALLETLPITIKANQSLQLHFTFHPTWLGSWNASTVFSNDTMQLATVAMLGRSTGQLRLMLDTAALANAAASGALTLRMESTPATLNFDTIGFTLSWNHDLASLGTLTETCSGSATDTGLCNYTLSSNTLPNGDQSYQLLRKSTRMAPTLALGTNALMLPINASFVTKATSSSVRFSNLVSGSYSRTTGDAGLIAVASICADSTIRAGLDGMLGTVLLQAQPNPANDHLQLTLRSKDPTSVRLQLTNMLGRKLYQEEIAVGPQSLQQRIPLQHIPSGDYILRARTSGGKVNSIRIVIAH